MKQIESFAIYTKLFDAGCGIAGLMEKSASLVYIRTENWHFYTILKILLIFTYIFVYFYKFTDILARSYWARYTGGLVKKQVHLKNIYL